MLIDKQCTKLCLYYSNDNNDDNNNEIDNNTVIITIINNYYNKNGNLPIIFLKGALLFKCYVLQFTTKI